MKKIVLFLYVILFSIITKAQSSTERPAILLGAITKDSLLKPPYNKWYMQEYNEYGPSPAVISELRKLNTKNITVSVFLGTWCGDSRRDVPRFLKILDAIAFPADRVSMYALGGFDSLYKQSPWHEEVGKGIFRVPIFIIYKNGVEVNRINEFPVTSMEKDFYAILNNEPYTPNYKSFSLIKNWLSGNVLTDKNSSIRGLSLQLKNLVEGEHELNSLGYVLLKQGKKEEAIAVFRINTYLYPESANVISSLGEGYHSAGDDV